MPHVAGTFLWLFRHVPDRALLEPLNRRLAARWAALTAGTRAAAAAAPRIDREALHWLAADHYYDTSRLHALGWRPLHPVSTGPVGDTIRALLAQGFLPPSGARALPAW
jgi:hypothetical protein